MRYTTQRLVAVCVDGPSDGPSRNVPLGNPIPSVPIPVIPLFFPFSHPPRPPYSVRAPAEKKKGGPVRAVRAVRSTYNLPHPPVHHTDQGAKADDNNDAGTGQSTGPQSTVWTFFFFFSLPLPLPLQPQPQLQLQLQLHTHTGPNTRPEKGPRCFPMSTNAYPRLCRCQLGPQTNKQRCSNNHTSMNHTHIQRILYTRYTHTIHIDVLLYWRDRTPPSP